MDNSDLPRAIAKANRGDALCDDEEIQIRAMMDELFVTSAISHKSTVHSKSLHDRSLDVDYVVGILENNPGLIPHWERFRNFAELISPEYGQSVDRRLNESGKNGGSGGDT